MISKFHNTCIVAVILFITTLSGNSGAIFLAYRLPNRLKTSKPLASAHPDHSGFWCLYVCVFAHMLNWSLLNPIVSAIRLLFGFLYLALFMGKTEKLF